MMLSAINMLNQKIDTIRDTHIYYSKAKTHKLKAYLKIIKYPYLLSKNI